MTCIEFYLSDHHRLLCEGLRDHECTVIGWRKMSFGNPNLWFLVWNIAFWSVPISLSSDVHSQLAHCVQLPQSSVVSQVYWLHRSSNIYHHTMYSLQMDTGVYSLPQSKEVSCHSSPGKCGFYDRSLVSSKVWAWASATSPSSSQCTEQLDHGGPMMA